MNWTKQHPATVPAARFGAAMAYDAATGDMVLFGGVRRGDRRVRGTWVWDGTDWTQQHPATHPPARWAASMAYATATGNMVLFGGYSYNTASAFGDTWVWGSN